MVAALLRFDGVLKLWVQTVPRLALTAAGAGVGRIHEGGGGAIVEGQRLAAAWHHAASATRGTCSPHCWRNCVSDCRLTVI